MNIGGDPVSLRQLVEGVKQLPFARRVDQISVGCVIDIVIIQRVFWFAHNLEVRVAGCGGLSQRLVGSGGSEKAGDEKRDVFFEFSWVSRAGSTLMKRN